VAGAVGAAGAAPEAEREAEREDAALTS
jgi:hypothetical protein